MKTTSLTPNAPKSIKIPKRDDGRVILHFDYDCFYASVFENETPSLRSQPLGVQQKSILATCNYVARARGVAKLMTVAEARRACPDLVLVNGEDLGRFRAVSRRLWAFLRAHAWGRRAERLGLDEVFLDVTDVVAYNADILGPRAPAFFHLDRADPVKGFAFDPSRFRGCVRSGAVVVDDKGDGVVATVEVDFGNPLSVRLMLASHLAGYLRQRLDEDFGYTSSGGVCTSKLLAKLAGSVNKPNNQTTLLVVAATKGGGGGNDREEEEEEEDVDVVGAFMDAHSIRKVPGIGSRTAQLIEEHLLGQPTERRDRYGGAVTVGDVRRHPGMSADMLERILDRPGAERGGGDKVWGLLHGVDASEVKETGDVPTQISVEDTYMARPLQTPAEVARELHALATSLVRRMREDLTEADVEFPTTTTTTTTTTTRWLAYPKTLRLSTRTKPKQTVGSSSAAAAAEAPSFSRSSRSAPLPGFAFHLSSAGAPACEEIAERLVAETLHPLFRRLHPERRGGWNLALLNVCATNMVPVAGGAGTGTGTGAGAAAPGRDIGRMFRTQGDVLREWTVYDPSPPPPPPPPPPASPRVAAEPGIGARRYVDAYMAGGEGEKEEVQQRHERIAVGGGDNPSGDAKAEDDDDDDNDNDNNEEGDDVDVDVDDAWEEQEDLGSHRCRICERPIPTFAIAAHERFHSMDD
ncbi:putative impB mucB samB family protein [Rosellinia necatrix]|uniref:Putative impB mucB samB family protein n=1 Tax=Rosellinia necatrix TaxID=77044 RepID=A0A1W2TUR8_ROSNE|nr:putative impB mucB samB family protein [Rosellinia necatrix]